MSNSDSIGLSSFATNIGEIPEWIENKKNGLLILPCSQEKLAEKILSAQNPQLCSALCNAAREKIKKTVNGTP